MKRLFDSKYKRYWLSCAQSRVVLGSESGGLSKFLFRAGNPVDEAEFVDLINIFLPSHDSGGQQVKKSDRCTRHPKDHKVLLPPALSAGVRRVSLPRVLPHTW